jgi:UDP-N-acetylglucosamine 2-epimerase (non-hydrolysing)
MIDTLLKQLPNLREPTFWIELALSPGKYFVLTLHRPANVDENLKLLRLLHAIADGTDGMPVVFPVHPRTARSLRDIDGEIPGLHYVDPQGYLEFNYLVKHARAVITDSGGITEESTVMGVPCLTLRNNTERPETVTIGTNELVGTDPAKLGPVLARLISGEWKKGGIPEKWDGRTAPRIVAELERLLK